MKKLLSLVLVLAMVLSVSSVAFAEDTYTEWTDNTTLPTSGTYKLMTDVTLNSKVTIGAWSGSTTTLKLDLNGYTVYANAELYVQNSGNLIIEDSSSTGSGKITNSAASYTSGNVIYVKGSCQIDGGTIENTKSSGVALYVHNGDNKQASCTMNGGTILNSYDKSGRAVKVNSNATFTMNGGTVENNAAGTDGTVPAIEGGAASSKIVINAGAAIEAAGTGIQSAGSPVEISGGKIEAGFYALETRYATVSGTAELTADKALLKPYSTPSTGDGNVITGGTFNAPQLIANSTIGDNGKNAQISGGTFSEGVDPSTHTGDNLVAKVGDDIIVGDENIEEYVQSLVDNGTAPDAITVSAISGSGELTVPEGVMVAASPNGDDLTVNGEKITSTTPAPAGPVPVEPQPTQAPVQNGKNYWVKYNGGNNFSTNKKDVPTSVEIDGMPVPFAGDGKNFTVSCILSGAERITVRWNSTSVTTNFEPDANAFCGTVDIPKTGDISIWAAIAAFFGF